MVTQQIEVDWKDLRRKFRGMIQNSRQPIRRRLENAGRYISAVAVTRAPVETGRLRDSIHVESDIGSTEVSMMFVADVPYAVYMEEGFTKRDGEWWEGKHFLRNTLEDYGYLIDDAIYYGMLEGLKSA